MYKKYREPFRERLKDELIRNFCRVFGHKSPLGIRMDDSKMGFGFCRRCYARQLLPKGYWEKLR